jgi:hypothetical protein
LLRSLHDRLSTLLKCGLSLPSRPNLVDDDAGFRKDQPPADCDIVEPVETLLTTESDRIVIGNGLVVVVVVGTRSFDSTDDRLPPAVARVDDGGAGGLMKDDDDDPPTPDGPATAGLSLIIQITTNSLNIEHFLLYVNSFIRTRRFIIN